MDLDKTAGYLCFLDGSEHEITEWHANRLTAMHKGHASQRILGKHHDLTGAKAEWAFARTYGLPPHLEFTEKNDGRIDFIINGFRIDVKGARRDYGLAREAAKPHCELLVLGLVSHERNAVLVAGWEFDEEILKRPPRRIHPEGPLNHICPTADLKPMRDFEAYVGISPLQSPLQGAH